MPAATTENVTWLSSGSSSAKQGNLEHAPPPFRHCFLTEKGLNNTLAASFTEGGEGIRRWAENTLATVQAQTPCYDGELKVDLE